MRRVVVLLFLSAVPFVASAQRLVRDVLAKEKLRHDSAMFVRYGEMFHTHFEFDTTSYVWADGNHRCAWNGKMHGDTVLQYNFHYRFHFPGSQIYSGYVYGPATDERGRLIADTLPYRGRCTLINQATMDSITRKHLIKPLEKCQVKLYPLYHHRWADNTRNRKLDSSHVYLEVRFHKYQGNGRRGSKYKITDWTIIVDGCTGEVLGPVEKRTNSGIVGGRF